MRQARIFASFAVGAGGEELGSFGDEGDGTTVIVEGISVRE